MAASEEDRWRQSKLIAGGSTAITELFVIVSICEQIWSSSSWTMHRWVILIGLVAAAVWVPVPLFTVRKECEKLSDALLKNNSISAEDFRLKAIRLSMSNILTTSCFAAFFIVMAYQFLVER